MEMFENILVNKEGVQYGWMEGEIWVWLITHDNLERRSFSFPEEAIDLAYKKGATSLSLLDTTVGVTYFLGLPELYEKCQKKDRVLKILLSKMKASKKVGE